jgi:hypothetical protein
MPGNEAVGLTRDGGYLQAGINSYGTILTSRASAASPLNCRRDVYSWQLRWMVCEPTRSAPAGSESDLADKAVSRSSSPNSMPCLA